MCAGGEPRIGLTTLFVYAQIGDGTTTQRNSPVVVASFFATSLWDRKAVSIETASNDRVPLSVILPRVEQGWDFFYPDFFLSLHHLRHFYDNCP